MDKIFVINSARVSRIKPAAAHSMRVGTASCAAVDPAPRSDTTSGQCRRLGAALVAGPRLVWDSGLTCSFLACLIFSFSALFVKLTGGRVPVLEVCLVRSSTSAGLTFLLMWLTGINWRMWFGKHSNLRLLFLRGCCGACSMTTYYVALFLLPLGDAVTINLIGPPFTAVFARLLLKEPLGYRGGAGCLVSLLGVVLVARPPFLFGSGHEEWARSRSIGTAAGLLSAVLGGGSSMTIRLIGGSEPAAVIALWFHCATLVLSVIPLAAGVPNKAVLLSGVDGSLMLGVAGTSFVAQLLSTRGLQRCQAAKAAAMGFTQVVYSHSMGAVFFDDKLTLGGLLGTLLILAGVLLVTLRLPAGSSSGSKAGGAAVCADTAAVGSKLADSGTISDNDAAALLAGDHVPSHLSAADKAGREDTAAAVGVVTLRADSGLSANPRAASPAEEAKQLLAISGMDSAAEQDNSEVQTDSLLAQIAASAAAALGGELCPVASAASALGLSRQVSRQLAASIAVSRQASQFLVGSPSVFLTAPGIPGLSTRAWDWQGLQLQQPAAQQAQPLEEPVSGQEGQRRRSSRPAQLEPAATAAAVQVQATCVSPGLRQALLLQGEHSSPGRRSPALLEQQQEREAAPPL